MGRNGKPIQHDITQYSVSAQKIVSLKRALVKGTRLLKACFVQQARETKRKPQNMLRSTGTGE